MQNASPMTRYAVWAFMLLMLVVMALAATPAVAQQFIPAPGQGANSAWTVYAFGNAQAVSDAFRAMSNFTASSVFKGLVSMLAIIGLLAVGASSGFSPAIARQFISYMVFAFLIVYMLFGVGASGPVSVRVEVIDTVDNTWKAPVTVPAVVGIPASIISMAGHKMTEQVEASFPIPDGLKLSQGAPFNLPASMLADATQAKIQDPNLAATLGNYVQDCFMIGVVRGDVSVSTLMNSTDFLSDIRVNYISVYVNSLLGDASDSPESVGIPHLVSCQQAHNQIQTRINAAGGDAASFLNNASAWHTTPALSVVNAAADDVASWATNGSLNSGGSLVKQAAVLAAFDPAFSQAAIATGNSDFLTALSITQATEAQTNSWIIGAEVFNRIMGYVFAVLQVFVYAITPLILAAALIPNLGMSLLKNFGQVLIWLAICQPMLAIVNFIVISMQQANLGGALNALGGPGFTLTNIPIISERTATMGAAATFVGTMVPVLAWAFVKGSVDFSRMIGSAVGENFSQQAGNIATTGNYSLNQAGMDSFTANKTSISAVSDFGNGYSVNSTERFQGKSDFGGGSVLAGGTPINMTASGGSAMARQDSTNSGFTETGTYNQSTGVTTTGADTRSSNASSQVSGNTTSLTALQAGVNGQAGMSLSSNSNGSASTNGTGALPLGVGGVGGASAQASANTATGGALSGRAGGAMSAGISFNNLNAESAQESMGVGSATQRGVQTSDGETTSRTLTTTRGGASSSSVASNSAVQVSGMGNAYERFQMMRAFAEQGNFARWGGGALSGPVAGAGDPVADSLKNPDNPASQQYMGAISPNYTPALETAAGAAQGVQASGDAEREAKASAARQRQARADADIADRMAREGQQVAQNQDHLGNRPGQKVLGVVESGLNALDKIGQGGQKAANAMLGSVNEKMGTNFKMPETARTNPLSLDKDVAGSLNAPVAGTGSPSGNEPAKESGAAGAQPVSSVSQSGMHGLLHGAAVAQNMQPAAMAQAPVMQPTPAQAPAPSSVDQMNMAALNPSAAGNTGAAGQGGELTSTDPNTAAQAAAAELAQQRVSELEAQNRQLAGDYATIGNRLGQWEPTGLNVQQQADYHEMLNLAQNNRNTG